MGNLRYVTEILAKPSPMLLEKMKELYDGGGTYASIGRNLSKDSRYVKKYLQLDMKKKPKDTNRDEKTTQISSQTEGELAAKVFKKFDAGLNPVKVVEALKITPSEAESLYLTYKRLNGIRCLSEEEEDCLKNTMDTIREYYPDAKTFDELYQGVDDLVNYMWPIAKGSHFKIPCPKCGKSMEFSEDDDDWQKERAVLFEAFKGWSHTNC